MFTYLLTRPGAGDRKLKEQAEGVGGLDDPVMGDLALWKEL